MAVPPSLKVSVGVPPVVLTVTTSLMVSEVVTVLPALRSPLEGDSAIDDTVGPVVVAAACTTASMIPPFSSVVDAVATKLVWVADTIWYSDRR